MIIGVDGNEANVNRHVGVSVYTLNLLRYFQKNATENIGFKIYLRARPNATMPIETQYFKYKIVSGPFGWSQLFMPLHLNIHRDINLFFTPAHYAPRYCPVPLVVSVHDLSYFYYPEEFLQKDLYKLKTWTEYSVQKAQKIISVSKTTKKDIMKFYSIPDEKIEVIYNGYEKDTDNAKKTDLPENLRSLKKYILYVGTIQPRKNLINLIKAFYAFQKNHNDYSLVIVGKRGWLADEIYQEAEKLGINDLVIFTGYLEDAYVNELYRNAFCFVLPSLYEGFGIPILEAMSHKCPVLTSYRSSLPEIGSEACLYFDPSKPEEIEGKLELLSRSNDLRNDLIKKGLERVTQFSWDDCGKKTMTLLQDCLHT